MWKLCAFVVLTGLSVAAQRSAAQDKMPGVVHFSDSAGPASERSSHEYDCGQVGGHKVEFVFENHQGTASAVTRLRVDGRDYTGKVNDIDDLGGSYLQNPHLFCRDVGVVIGLQAIDRKHPAPRRNVEISVNSKTSEVDVRELIDSDGSIEKETMPCYIRVRFPALGVTANPLRSGQVVSLRASFQGTVHWRSAAIPRVLNAIFPDWGRQVL